MRTEYGKLVKEFDFATIISGQKISFLSKLKLGSFCTFMAQQTFTISLLGFDERTTEFLSSKTQKTMCIVDPINSDDTQVVVVDIDEPNGIALWHEFREKWPDMPAVITASEDPEIEDASFADKPFTVEDLIDNITEAIVLFSTSEVTLASIDVSQPDLDPAVLAFITGESAENTSEDESELEKIELEFAPEEPVEISTETEIEELSTEKEIPPLSEIAGGLTASSSPTSAVFNKALEVSDSDDSTFDPDAHMIGLVLEGISAGKKAGTIAQLNCLLDRTIYIDAINKQVKSNLTDIHMRQIAIAPLGEGDSGLDTKVELIKATTLEEISGAEGTIYPLESFIWELAILTSNGRVPIGTPIDKPTYLMQWPNFTRLKPLPNDMKIAAYWLHMPSSLADLSHNLNLPMNQINLLYSAAALTGIAGIAQRKSDYLLKPGKPEEHTNRSLFGSIMNRLGKGQTDEQ